MLAPITPFSEVALADALANDHTSSEVIKTKKHFQYLVQYLGDPEVNAKTIVVEDAYISKDYLHDYASYYSLCFVPYSKLCKRVHFFSLAFSEQEFSNMLEGRQGPMDIPGSYLGFIVVKPIPYTIIGFTLLKVYSNSPGTRLFWGAKKYVVHLYGKQLSVESLAFQEQDTILAACATTAIWSMLNRASDYHICLLKSPSEITKDSGNLSNDGSRLFPNKGLDIRQICQAIYQSGLATEVRQSNVPLPEPPVTDPPTPPLHPTNIIKKVVSKEYLKKILNAYSSIGIPLILVVAVPKVVGYGLHAITVSGFKHPGPTPIPPTTKISYHSDNIEKFYAHDDQWGPFVRVEWFSDFEINTPWDRDTRKTYVLQIIVPTFPKIRIPYEDIQIIVEGLDRILTTIFGLKTVFDLVWDIKLDFSENYKKQVADLDPTIFPNKINHLKKSLPKYVWIATCYIGANPVLKFAFDATGVEKAMLGLDILSFLPQEITDDIFSFLDTNKNNSSIVGVFSHPSSNEYYKFFLDNIKS